MNILLLFLFIFNHVFVLARNERNARLSTHTLLEELKNNQRIIIQNLEQLRREVKEVATTIEDFIPTDCSGFKSKGRWMQIERIKPPEMNIREVRCNQFILGGGWTIVISRDAKHRIQKSSNHNNENLLPGAEYSSSFNKNSNYDFVNFNQSWREYKQGFGYPQTEYWLGNDVLHSLTKERPWEALVELEDWNGNQVQAIWDNFRILGEDKRYKLEISGYRKDKSNLTDGLMYHGESLFSTFDSDNDNNDVHCARKYGGGWWFNRCHVSHLTGVHLDPGEKGYHAVHWLPWKNSPESLRKAELMIRPRNFAK